jgi:hypothetical protein
MLNNEAVWWPDDVVEPSFNIVFVSSTLFGFHAIKFFGKFLMKLLNAQGIW